MQSTRQRIGDAPVLIFDPGPSCRGTVLVYHGLTSSKDDQEKELLSLVQRGFLTVGVDAVGHGERRNPKLELLMRAPDHHIKFLEMVVKTVSEIPDLVSQLRQLYPHAGRFGLTGISMGGYIAFTAAAAFDIFQAVAPILGSPDWSARSPRPLPGSFSVRSPHNFPEKFAPTALLVQNAGRDEHVDPAPAREFVETLRPYYHDHPRRLQHYEYPRSGHFMREEDWNLLWSRTEDWFLRYL